MAVDNDIRRRAGPGAHSGAATPSLPTNSGATSPAPGTPPLLPGVPVPVAPPPPRDEPTNPFFRPAATGGTPDAKIKGAIDMYNDAAKALQQANPRDSAYLANEAVKKLMGLRGIARNQQEYTHIQNNLIASVELAAVAAADTEGSSAETILQQFMDRVCNIFPTRQAVVRQNRAFIRLARTAMSRGMIRFANSAYQWALGISHQNGAIVTQVDILVDWAARLFAIGYDGEARVVLSSLARGQAWAHAPQLANIVRAAVQIPPMIEEINCILPGGLPGEPPLLTNALADIGRLQNMADQFIRLGFPQFAAETLARLARFEAQTGHPDLGSVIDRANRAYQMVIDEAGRQGDKPRVAELEAARLILENLRRKAPPPYLQAAGSHGGQAATTGMQAGAASQQACAYYTARGDTAMEEGRARLAGGKGGEAQGVFAAAAHAYEEAGVNWHNARRPDLAVEAYIQRAMAQMAADGGSGSNIGNIVSHFRQVTAHLFRGREYADTRRANAFVSLGREAIAHGHGLLATAAMDAAVPLFLNNGDARHAISILLENARLHISGGDLEGAYRLCQQAKNLALEQGGTRVAEKAVLDPATEEFGKFIRTHEGQTKLVTLAKKLVAQLQAESQKQATPVRPTSPAKAGPTVHTTQPAEPPIPPPNPGVRRPFPEPSPRDGRTLFAASQYNQAMRHFATEAEAFARTGNAGSAITAIVNSVRAAIMADIAAVHEEIRSHIPLNTNNARQAVHRFTNFLETHFANSSETRFDAMDALYQILDSPAIKEALSPVPTKRYNLRSVKDALGQLSARQVKIVKSPPKAPPPRLPFGDPPAPTGGASTGDTKTAKGSGVAPGPVKGPGPKVQRVVLAEGALQFGAVTVITFGAAALNKAGYLSNGGFAAYGIGGTAAGLWAFPIIGPLSAPFVPPVVGLADEMAADAGIENPYARLAAQAVGGAAGGVAAGAILQKALQAIYGKELIHASEEAMRMFIKRGALAIGNAGLAVEGGILAALAWGRRVGPVVARAAGAAGGVIARRAAAASIIAAADGPLPVGDAAGVVIIVTGLVEGGIKAYRIARE